MTKCIKLNPECKIIVCGCASENSIEQFEENITASDTDLSKVENKMPSMQGERPSMPEGMEPPNMQNGERPNMPEGMKMPNKGGGMPINEDVVSIVDYLQQRIENIKTQLS